MKKMLFVTVFAMVLLSASAVFAEHSVMVAEANSADAHLVDSKGMTLYWFTKDSIGQSACSGGCVEKWPIYYREKIAPQKGTTSADYGEILRSDGKKQTTFRGYPLYYFFKDKMAGDTYGEGVKGVWYVIDPNKFPKG